jgi:hypothetical protein
MGWYEFLLSIDVNPSTYRSWKSRMESKFQLLIEAGEEAVPADSASKTKVPIPTPPKPRFEGDQKREEATQTLLEQQKEAVRLEQERKATASKVARLQDEYSSTVVAAAVHSDGASVANIAEVDAVKGTPDVAKVRLAKINAKIEAAAEITPSVGDQSEVLTPASDASPIPPLPGATFTRADTLVKDLKRADEGSLVVTTPAPTSKAPLLEGDVVSDRVRGAYATLRRVLNRMADTADIESTLQKTLEEYILPILNEHPYMQVDTPFRPELQISVTLHRAGRARICAGDWVEYRGGDDRLTKQIGAEAAVGRVVEADPFSRPRVIWSNGTKWLKPYSLFNQEAVHVLFAEQASAYPAFSTYSAPALSKPPAAISTMEADASASSLPSADAALAASAGDHGMEDPRENPVLSNAVSPSPAESLSEDNLPAHSEGPVTLGFMPHGEATWTQLVPGKKYQIRPAPSGGYGIYEPRSTVILQWYVGEDDARDAIDRVTAIAVGA